MNHRGFTLLELVIVLGILSIVLGIAALSIVSFRDRELDYMLEDLRFARTYAVSHQKTVQVHFDMHEDRYSITENTSGKELLRRDLSKVDLIKAHYITDPLLIYPSGAFSRCGHLEISYRNEIQRLNFTVGVARFTLTQP